MMGASFAAVGSMVAMAGMPGVGITRDLRRDHRRRFLRHAHRPPFMSRIVRFFPPLVTGTVITSIGMCLFPVAINWAGGGKGAEDFGSCASVPLQPGALHHPPDQPLHARFLGQHLGADGHGPGLRDRRRHGHGRPRWSGERPGSTSSPAALRRADLRSGAPILSMCLVVVIIFVESTGMFFALGKITGREITPDRTAPRPALRRRRLVFAGFEHLHHSSFAQNIGLVQMTGAQQLRHGGCRRFPDPLSMLPKAAFLVAFDPAGGTGGAGIAMRPGMAASGIQILHEANITDRRQPVAGGGKHRHGAGGAPDFFARLPVLDGADHP